MRTEEECDGVNERDWPYHYADDGMLWYDWRAHDQRAIKALHGKRHIGWKLLVLNGVFDLFHAGHVSLFRYAYWRGPAAGTVIVAVNSDESVERIRGRKPVQTLQDRLRIVLSSRYVNAAVGFTEDTPQALYEALKPDYVIKGAEYQDKGPLPGQEHCGTVLWAPMLEGRHSSLIAKKVCETHHVVPVLADHLPQP